MKTVRVSRAEDWFKDSFDFRQLCHDAKSQARGERAEEFAHEMMIKSNTSGLSTALSEAQLKWLCDLADQRMPKLRNGTPVVRPPKKYRTSGDGEGSGEECQPNPAIADAAGNAETGHDEQNDRCEQ